MGVLSNVQPQGRDQWAANFEFYRVLGANVKLTVLTNQPGDITAPPSTDTWVFAYELDEQLGRVSDSVEALMVTKHAKREFISTAPQTMTHTGSGFAFSAQHPNSRVLTYSYNPNNWDYHVQEQGEEERWTPIGQNPSFIHNMAIRLIGLDGQAIADNQWELLLQIEYTVQFREAKHTLLKTREGIVAPDSTQPTT